MLVSGYDRDVLLVKLPSAKVNELPTMALTRKYDFARATAPPEESSVSRSCVAASDWTSSSGRLVVLLKAIAGVTHDGALKMRVMAAPIAIDRRP